jgi:FAD/FMN-containing dehydrogenase
VNARGGGHSYTAYSLGSANGHLIIDLRRFDNITVDSSTGHAEIGAGSRLGDIALGLNNHNRAMSHGLCPYVGIGGHALFGG